MKNKNVCKFPSSSISNGLAVSCFVLETDIRAMTTQLTLTNHRMILVESGDGEFSFDKTPCTFSSGSLIFGFQGESFYLKKGRDVKYIYIEFGDSRANTLLTRFGISKENRKFENFNGLIPFCKDCLLRTQESNIDIASESVLLYVFSRLSASVAVQNDTIKKIIDFTEENFKNPDLTISVVSKEIGYNPKYLSHLFKNKMKVNYSEYLRAFRFKYAISLFELGISSVKNVAFLSGFSDPLYFSSAFKKAVGISPKQFILKISNEKN